MNIAVTIIPIFVVIFIGWAAHLKRFINPEFVGPANRIVFYIAVPALVFKVISKSSLQAQFNLTVVLITLFSMTLTFFLAWILGKCLCIERNQTGTFVQTSLHGNVGYIGLAVAFYYLGEEGLVRASILSGFVMLLQNFLAVVILQLYSDDVRSSGNSLHVIKAIVGNPVVIACLMGIVFSAFQIPVPVVVARSLDIVAGLALPMALLVIGASLTFDQVRDCFSVVLSTSGIKLIFMPTVGCLLFAMFQINVQEYLPALILLATPTATISYVMAKEMRGDPDFAVSAISISTLLSAITMAFWLKLLS